MSVVPIHDPEVATDGTIPVVFFHIMALFDASGATHALVLLAHLLARLEVGDGESIVGAGGLVVDTRVHKKISKIPDFAFTLVFLGFGDSCAHGFVGHERSRAVTHIAFAVLESTLATSSAAAIVKLAQIKNEPTL